MAVSESYLNFIEDQLQGINDLSFKKMFGGIGVFQNGKMFGLINSKDVFHLKADDELANEFIEMGSEKMGSKGKSKSGMPYYSINEKLLENKDLLLSYVQKSIDLAHKI